MSRTSRRLPATLSVTLLLLGWALGAPRAGAQEPDPDSAILLIMDSSGSMAADDGTGQTKIAAAKEALLGLVDELPEGANVGLRVYGHRVPNTDMQRGCRDTELIEPVGPLDPERMRERIRSYDARGFTPIGLSLRLGARDLPAAANRTMILVSDGIDTCGVPPPCEVARQLARRDVDLRIETVGFQVDAEARDMLRCIADATGGTYTEAPNADELAERLRELSLRALRLYRPMGAPVQGSQSSGTAPVLEPGQYTDAISPGETTWYAVELEAGQSVAVSATMVAVGERISLFPPLPILRMRALSPVLDESVTEFHQLSGLETTTLAFRSPVVGTEEDFGRWEEPGAYRFAVELLEGEPLPSPEYPLELTFEVFGEGVEGEAAGPGVQTEEPGTVTSSDRGLALPLAVAFGGALLGAVAGAALVARRRP
jgi:Ca-activated chloride channel homolog